MDATDAAPGAEFIEFEPIRVVASVLLRSIRPLAALGAGEVNDDAVALAFCHDWLLMKLAAA